MAGLAIGLVFGLARSLPLLATAPMRTPAQLQRLHRRIDRLDVPVRRSVWVLQASVAAAALLVAVGAGVVA